MVQWDTEDDICDVYYVKMDDLMGVIEAVDDYWHDSDRIYACIQCDSDGAMKSMTQGQRGRILKIHQSGRYKIGYVS